MRALLLLFALGSSPALSDPVRISGIYPHLAMFNGQGECGTGAVVPWAGRLWVVTYAPHQPGGSDDKLYEITPDLEQIVRPESIGGTPANRMIHAESNQLLIGPYAIDSARTVRAIPYASMFGRPTGNAQHLTDPAGKILYATMEEGIYEVDVQSLAVTELWADEQSGTDRRKADLPGYHGKGFYSGQGVYVYANNGDHGAAAQQRPDVPSGVLAEWNGVDAAWTIVRRNQFTEVTGPGGIAGNPHPALDPIWTVGWDAKSLLLGVRMPRDGWSFYRLPKGSHSYDGAHGWNTEWPRIRDIGEDALLMTMHGTFWRFPRSFAPANSAGVAPRSNYLKVIGDFCRWNDELVFGCDDTAANEFLNKRKAKGKIAAPQSQSNLWFLDPDQLDSLGPVIGRGAVWLNDQVQADAPSDPYLFSGYDLRHLQIGHDATTEVAFRIEVDRNGDDQWTAMKTVTVPPATTEGVSFPTAERGAWLRLVPSAACRATAVFSCRNRDSRPAGPDPILDGLAGSDRIVGGLIRSRAGNARTLAFAAMTPVGPIGCYELDQDLALKPTSDPNLLRHTLEHTAIPGQVLTVDDASVLYTDDAGQRWRIPKGDPRMDRHPFGAYRISREVATERDLFNAHGTFYELPAENAGGFAKVRAVATHNRFVHDYCSYRGLFVLSGIDAEHSGDNPHIIHSSDGKAALWVGAIDDIWKLGKPVGSGGPWKESAVKRDESSDPYLMTGYDQKSLQLSVSEPATITAEIDLTGSGHWIVYQRFAVGDALAHEFPEAFQAYWIRFRADRDCTATATLHYR